MGGSKIFDYLKGTPEGTLDLLFGDDSTAMCTCRALFQLLDPISTTLITRILFLAEPVAISDIREFFNDSAFAQLQILLTNLRSLSVLVSATQVYAKEPTETIALNPRFREGIVTAICDPVEPWSHSAAAKALKVDKKAPTRAALERYASEKWDELLRFIVGITKSAPTTSEATINAQKIQYSIMENFARSFNLMFDDVVAPGKQELRITAKGYEYMLKDREEQVWDYVAASISRTTLQHEALSLLFMLSCCEFGRYYPIDALTKVQRQLVFEFSQLGLIYMHNVASSRFYPTRAAIDLLFRRSAKASKEDYGAEGGDSENVASTDQSREFSIIVETNCQVIAYVTDELHLALLKLFVDLQVRLPNMAVGRITRERAKAAFRMGLSAAQIVEFLRSHAHPIVLGRQNAENPIVPDNVSDQLKLWESENYRLKFAEAVLFPLGNVPAISTDQFRKLVAYARRTGALLWLDETTRAMAVTPKGAVDIQAYAEHSLLT